MRIFCLCISAIVWMSCVSEPAKEQPEVRYRSLAEVENEDGTFSTVEPEKVGAIGTGIEVGVPFPGREVRARVWRMDIGGVPLILLDTDVESNSEEDRAITDRLYMGTAQHRLEQEMVLGIGGARALAALGWDIEIYHLNEGHAGFITLELIDRVIGAGDLATAVARVRKDLVFTTHTPVPAGIAKLRRDTLGPYLELWAQRWNVDLADLWRLGSDPGDGDTFNTCPHRLMSNGHSRHPLQHRCRIGRHIS